MKNIASTVLTFGLVLILNACCTKKDCISAEELYEINFYNFSEADLDTITIISYVKNSNFTTIIDSTVTDAYSRGEYFTAFTNNRNKTNFEYKISLVSTKQVFTLTDFALEKEGCNSCFPYRPESDFYDVLKGYQVNGQRQTGSQIKIYK